MGTHTQYDRGFHEVVGSFEKNYCAKRRRALPSANVTCFCPWRLFRVGAVGIGAAVAGLVGKVIAASRAPMAESGFRNFTIVKHDTHPNMTPST